MSHQKCHPSLCHAPTATCCHAAMQVLAGVPDISDVHSMLDVLRSLGASVAGPSGPAWELAQPTARTTAMTDCGGTHGSPWGSSSNAGWQRSRCVEVQVTQLHGVKPDTAAMKRLRGGFLVLGVYVC